MTKAGEAAQSYPKPPKGTRAAGRELWEWSVREFELDPHETALLKEAVRLIDRLDALAAAVDAEGVLVATLAGTKPHPALVESRQQAIALARVLAALRMPSGDEAASRPQRRVGVRGVYSGGGQTSRPRLVS